MIEVKNTRSDAVFQKLYQNKLFWWFFQFIFGTLPSVFLIQNQINVLQININEIIKNQSVSSVLSNFVEAIVMVAEIFTFLLLIFFPILTKNILNFRNKLFPVVLILLIPHSWTLGNFIIQTPFINPILKFLFLASPVIVIALHLHKAITEKISEVKP